MSNELPLLQNDPGPAFIEKAMAVLKEHDGTLPFPAYAALRAEWMEVFRKRSELADAANTVAPFIVIPPELLKALWPDAGLPGVPVVRGVELAGPPLAAASEKLAAKDMSELNALLRQIAAQPEAKPAVEEYTAHESPGRRFATNSSRGDHLLGLWGFFAHAFLFFALGAGVGTDWADGDERWVAPMWFAGLLLIPRAVTVGATTTKESIRAIRRAWFSNP